MVFQLLNPTEFMANTMVEREFVECTSSVIQALDLFRKLYPDHRKKEINRSIEKAVQFIQDNQTPDGSWYKHNSCFCVGLQKNDQNSTNVIENIQNYNM